MWIAGAAVGIGGLVGGALCQRSLETATAALTEEDRRALTDGTRWAERGGAAAALAAVALLVALGRGPAALAAALGALGLGAAALALIRWRRASGLAGAGPYRAAAVGLAASTAAAGGGLALYLLG